MNITCEIENISINGINYKVTPLLRNQIYTDFERYLNSLDADLYNATLEEFSNRYDLKYFSDLYTSDYLTKDKVEELKKLITRFKYCTKIVVRHKIQYLKTFLPKPNMLNLALESVKECVNFYELNGLTNIQDFINWEDEINKLVTKDHNIKE